MASTFRELGHELGLTDEQIEAALDLSTRIAPHDKDLDRAIHAEDGSTSPVSEEWLAAIYRAAGFVPTPE